MPQNGRVGKLGLGGVSSGEGRGVITIPPVSIAIRRKRGSVSQECQSITSHTYTVQVVNNMVKGHHLGNGYGKGLPPYFW